MRAREEYAIVLDFLKHGYSEDSRQLRQKDPVLQVIGKDYFTVMELVPYPDLFFKPHDEVYIGAGKRDQIKFIKGMLDPTKLTQTARNELPFIVEKLVDAKEAKFVEFFNKSGAVSLRAHQLELLPGIGKKHAGMIIQAREDRPFMDFEDIKRRVTAIPNPKKLIIQRIIDEIDRKDRFSLFVST